MLDNANYIAQKDAADALGLAAATPAQLRHNFSVPKTTPSAPIHNIVLAGMGGSALQAELASVFPELSVPFVICRDYTLPSFVNENTLVIASSYSGNTEETLSALAEARSKGATIVVMSGGGTLKEEAIAAGELFVEIPKAVQPRMAVFYAYRALVEILIAYGLADDSALAQLETTADHLEKAIEAWKKEVPTTENPAKQLAQDCVGKTLIIYASNQMKAAAYKWKISANENAKNTAWCNALPEFNHNEFIGWSSHPVEKPFAVIDLVSSFDHPRIRQRFELTDRLLSGMRPHATTIEARGETPLEQLLYLVLFGDFVTLYMGILNGLDPSPVELVERFKKELG